MTRWVVHRPDGSAVPGTLTRSKTASINAYLATLSPEELTNGRETWHWHRRRDALKVIRIDCPDHEDPA